MNSSSKTIKRINQKTAVERYSGTGSNGVPKKNGQLVRNKMCVQADIREKRNTNQASKNSQQGMRASRGVIGSKHLQSIYNLVGDSKQRSPGDGRENQDVTLNASNQERPLTKAEDAIINSVMQQVAELNRDKLSEDSLVKVLAAVYLDAKSKITGKESLSPGVPVGFHDEKNAKKPEIYEPSEEQNAVTENQTNTINKMTPPAQPLSISERKRIQWEKEKAELEALSVQDPWSKVETTKVTTPTVSSLSLPAGPPVINSVASSFSGQPPPALSTSDAPPALTPMAFAAHEESERIKREEQRKQWKSELDRQVMEQRMLQEKVRLEEQRKNEALLNQMRLQQIATQPFVPVPIPVGTTGLSNGVAFPVIGPTTAHPSASHFASAAFLPATLLAPNPLSTGPIDSTITASVPLSISNTHTAPSDFAVVAGTDMSATPSMARTGFNRTRGFTQQIYTDPAVNAERARLAHEARMENLRQIEEKRRQKEEEKARRLLEEKLEDERIARERAQMMAIAEAEDQGRRRREELERQQLAQLHDNLIQARQNAEREKSMRHAAHTHADIVTNTPLNTASLGYIPEESQSQRPAELSMLNTNNMTQVPMAPAGQPLTNVLYLPQQVPMISSSGVQTACMEDAEVQTEPKCETKIKSLIPRCARELGPRYTPKKFTQPQSTGSSVGRSVAKSNVAVKTRTHAPTGTTQRTTNTTAQTTVESKVKTGGSSTPLAPDSSAKLQTTNQLLNQFQNPYGNDVNNRTFEKRDTFPINADVAETDYCKVTYTPQLDTNGPFPPYRPPSRQRKHTGFTPPPELPEPPRRRKSIPTASVEESVGTNASPPRSTQTRIPVPITQFSRDPPPGRQNRGCESPTGHPGVTSYFGGPLDRAGYGSLDLVRTHDVLNPFEVNTSLPISREPSTKAEARETYLKTTNPALYGDPPVPSAHPPTLSKRTSVSTTAVNECSPTKPDQSNPLLYPNLVREHPTPRQDSILRHLSQIRKGLKMKQMLYESGNYDDEED